MPTTLPAPVQDALDELARALSALTPAPVLGAVLYGGAAKGKAHTPSSDLNILIVLADGSPASLERLAAPLAEARRRAGAAPLIVTADELPAAAEAFPVKFHDIVKVHRVLAGRDPLEGLRIAPERLKEDARRDLTGLSLRLKRLYATRADRPDLAQEGLVDALPSAVTDLATLLEVAGKAVPEHREDVLAEAGRHFGFDAAPLVELLAVKKGGASARRPSEFLAAFLEAAARGARA
ncbi:MAG: hypothetical protein FD126_1857 [Elusimicrobia bacterium]|nr:MAG: hypothetical protein FD126_1857 [Elusimicrobiota bacterium]